MVAVSTLHTVNKSPFEKTSLDSCLRVARPGATVLLYEDAVYAALTGTAVEERVRRALERCRVCVLEPDLAARGVDERDTIAGVERIDYAGFVELAAASERVNAWL